MTEFIVAVFVSIAFCLGCVSVAFAIARRTTEAVGKQFLEEMHKIKIEGLKSVLDQFEEEKKNIKKYEEQSLQDQAKVLDQQLREAQNQLQQITNYFYDSLNDNVTATLLAAAYRFVGTKLPPRNTEESDLIAAVLNHEKAGHPYLSKKPSVSLPNNNGMN